MRRSWFAALALLLITAASAAADDDAGGVSGGLTLTSDYLFRGVSQTLGGTAVQVYVGAESDSGLYGYVWASNIDFVPNGERDDGARYEINVAAGYATDLSDRVSVDTMLVQYLFPGTVPGMSYDYTELLVTLQYAEHVAATVGYSDGVFGADAVGTFYALSFKHELPAGLSLATRLGHYDLDNAFRASYAFSDLNVSRAFGEIDLTLAWHDTYGNADELFYSETVGSRFVVSLDLEFP